MKRCTHLVIVALVTLPIPAAAQQGQSVTLEPRLIISERAIAAGIAATPPPAPPPGGDSLKNGAILGAIAGAAVFGGFVTFLCNALQEPSDPSCLSSSLLGIGMGAGIGAAGGAGIDALAAFVPTGLRRDKSTSASSGLRRDKRP